MKIHGFAFKKGLHLVICIFASKKRVEMKMIHGFQCKKGFNVKI